MKRTMITASPIRSATTNPISPPSDIAAGTATGTFAEDEAKAAGFAGLAALRRARSKFDAAHPACRHCGAHRMDPQGACVLCGKAE